MVIINRFISSLPRTSFTRTSSLSARSLTVMPSASVIVRVTGGGAACGGGDIGRCSRRTPEEGRCDVAGRNGGRGGGMPGTLRVLTGPCLRGRLRRPDRLRRQRTRPARRLSRRGPRVRRPWRGRRRWPGRRGRHRWTRRRTSSLARGATGRGTSSRRNRRSLGSWSLPGHHARRRLRGQRRRRRGRPLFLDPQPDRRRDDTPGHRRLGGDGLGSLDPRRRCDSRRLDRFRRRRFDGHGHRRDGRRFGRRFGRRRLFDLRRLLRHGLRRGDRLDGFHQARRRQHRRGRFRRLRRFPGRRRLLTALGRRRLREDVAGRQRDVPLLGKPLHELARDDLFDRARRALHLDAVITLQKRRHFLARGAEQFRDLVNPDSCQKLPRTKRT